MKDKQLKLRIIGELKILNVKRGINALGALAIAAAEIVFAGVGVWFSGVADYQSAAIFGSLAGFATIADNAMRIRESATYQHIRMNQLRAILMQIDAPLDASPFWNEYISVSTDTHRIDYLSSVISLVTYEAPVTSTVQEENIAGR